MPSNLVKALLIINAAKKGWSDAARKKAALKRKRRAKMLKLHKEADARAATRPQESPEEFSRLLKAELPTHFRVNR